MLVGRKKEIELLNAILQDNSSKKKTGKSSDFLI